ARPGALRLGRRLGGKPGGRPQDQHGKGNSSLELRSTHAPTRQSPPASTPRGKARFDTGNQVPPVPKPASALGHLVPITVSASTGQGCAARLERQPIAA